MNDSEDQHPTVSEATYDVTLHIRIRTVELLTFDPPNYRETAYWIDGPFFNKRALYDTVEEAYKAINVKFQRKGVKVVNVGKAGE